MRSRHALTAALALSVVTILTVAACGSSVQGSAQVNTAAAESATSAATTATTSERTGRTSTAVPTDLSDLSSMLNDLSTELSVPDLSVPSDLTFPSELTDIPGFDSACLDYAFINLAILSGSDTVNGQNIQDALNSFGSGLPAEYASDIEALKELATEAKGKDVIAIGQLFAQEKYTTASDNIQKWVDANCSGG